MIQLKSNFNVEYDNIISVSDGSVILSTKDETLELSSFPVTLVVTKIHGDWPSNIQIQSSDIQIVVTAGTNCSISKGNISLTDPSEDSFTLNIEGPTEMRTDSNATVSVGDDL